MGGFIKTHPVAAPICVLGALVSIAGFAADAYSLVTTDLPNMAWAAIGAFIFFISMMAIVFKQHNAINAKSQQKNVSTKNTKAVSLEQSVDFDRWDSVFYFTVWQAAFLWVELEPQSSQKAAAPGSPCHDIWQRLRKAAINSEFKVVGQDGDIITVKRDELREYAIAHEMRPAFLFPEDRSNVSTRRVFRAIHGRPWSRY